MANCAQCGRELPSFSFGEASNVCASCRQLPVDPYPQPQGSNVVDAAKPQYPPYRPPVTVALVGINVLVFVAMVATGVPLLSPTSFYVLKWGANFGPLSLATQPWRILTSNYVHIGLVHLLLNMWGLWQVGRLSERIFGPWTYASIYTACGIAGSLASLLRNPTEVSAGASGALFGIVGALIGALYFGKTPLPKAAMQSLLKNLLVVVAVNLYLGAKIPGIDNSAHIGGLLMGLALGAIVGPQLMETPDRRRAHERLVFVGGLLLLTGFGMYVKRKNGYVTAFANLSRSAKSGRLEIAINQLEQTLKDNPDNKTALGFLGSTYLEKNDYANAARTLQHLSELDPGNLPVKYNLGLAYAGLGRYEDARRVYADLVQRDPDDDEAWTLLGAALDGVNREPEAVQAYQKAIALNPKNAEAYRQLGLAQMKLSRADAAISSLQQSAQLDPTNAETQRDLAQIFTALGRSSEAAAAAKRADQLSKTGKPTTASKP